MSCHETCHCEQKLLRGIQSYRVLKPDLFEHFEENYQSRVLNLLNLLPYVLNFCYPLGSKLNTLLYSLLVHIVIDVLENSRCKVGRARIMQFSGTSLSVENNGILILPRWKKTVVELSSLWVILVIKKVVESNFKE